MLRPSRSFHYSPWDGSFGVSGSFGDRQRSHEGILPGISCGAAVAVAVKVAQEPTMKDKMIVVILPDSGERYLSTALFEGIPEA